MGPLYLQKQKVVIPLDRCVTNDPTYFPFTSDGFNASAPNFVKSLIGRGMINFVAIRNILSTKLWTDYTASANFASLGITQKRNQTLSELELSRYRGFLNPL